MTSHLICMTKETLLIEHTSSKYSGIKFATFEHDTTTLSQNIKNAVACGAVSHPRITDTTCC
jgi:hypothetical protein